MALVLELVAGVLVVTLVLYDVFQTVVLPRRTDSPFRLVPYITLLVWPLWRRIGIRLHPDWRREDFLATFAPALLVVILVFWVTSLVLGYGLVMHALSDGIRPQPVDYPTACYLAGTSLLTLGFGDYVPTALATRAVTLVAAASGLAVVALVIALFFNLYGSFARREVLVLLLDSRAGVPPSGVMLLETFGRNQTIDDLAGTFAMYEIWTAEMLDSHLAYPILPFFRSSHDGQSWVSALGAVLDAATLLITTVQADAACCPKALAKNRAAAEMMYSIGCHALIDLTQQRVARRYMRGAQHLPGIERSEFEIACHRLSEAGYSVDCSDAAWESFARHRTVYAVRLNILAQYFSSSPTQWIGDRTLLNRPHVPHFGT